MSVPASVCLSEVHRGKCSSMSRTPQPHHFDPFISNICKHMWFKHLPYVMNQITAPIVSTSPYCVLSSCLHECTPVFSARLTVSVCSYTWNQYVSCWYCLVFLTHPLHTRRVLNNLCGFTSLQFSTLMPNCYFACFFGCCSGHRSRTVCFCINDWITYYSLMVTDPRERPLQWLQGKQLLAPLTSRYSHRFGWISQTQQHSALPLLGKDWG